MNAELLTTLRCPFCGCRMRLLEHPSAQVCEGDIVSGILGCSCCAYPVVAGIPYVRTGKVAESAMRLLGDGQPDAALTILLGLDPKRYQDLLTGYRLTFRDALSVLGPEAEGAYLFYRFSDPTYLCGEAVLRTVSRDCRCAGGRVLDLAGGAGHLARSVDIDRNYEVVVTDASFWKLWLAKRFVAPQCQPVCCDAEVPLPFARGSFSLVFCSDAFHYIWSRRLLAGEMVRLIDDRGAVVLTHLHNRLCDNLSPGMPLMPAEYRDLFKELGPRLFKESDVLANVLAGQPLELREDCRDEDLSNEPALVLVAARPDGPVTSANDIVGGETDRPLAINPLYVVEEDDTGSLLRLRFPSPFYEREYADCKRYLPLQVRLKRDQLALLRADALMASCDCWPTAVYCLPCQTITRDDWGGRGFMKPVAIVAGYLVGNPLGGHALSILHYLVGLKRLGYEVVFVEHYEWSNACYNPQTNTRSDDPTYGIDVLRRYLTQLGLGAWCYVDVNGIYHGLTREEVQRLCRKSAFLLSLWTVTWLPEFLECRRRIFVDLDPGFTQFAMLPKPARSNLGYASPLDFHFLFTYGARIGQSDCPIPTHGLTWMPTRPPVVLDLLPPRFTPDAQLFTTVMSWSARKPIVYEGEEYGQKDVEFWKVADLPKKVGPIFEIALAGADAPRERIAAHGWRLVDPKIITATGWTYRDYIARSRGEFSVAVNLEVKSRSGWFSDRTAAYLASGKPAIVQDTGFSETVPCNEGLFAFRTADDVALAVEAVATDYRRHCAAARRIAVDYFDSDRVLDTLLRRAEVEAPASRIDRVPVSAEVVS